jgi:hypothetical protein
MKTNMTNRVRRQLTRCSKPARVRLLVALTVLCLFEIVAPVSQAQDQPVIVTQPHGQTNLAGSTVTLSVEATGTPPLAYQWQRDTGFLDFYDLTDRTNAALVLPNLGASDAVNYRVVLTNISGAVTSDVVHLYVILPPTITSQPNPASQVASRGTTVTYRVTADSPHSPLAYQWRLNEVMLLDKTNSTLALTNVQFANAGAYTVVVTNLAGAVTSQVARLEVDAIFTKITTGPLVTDRHYSFLPCWGDYDNDGDLDVFVTPYMGSTPGTNQFYRNNGDGSFTRLTANEAGDIARNQTTSSRGLWLDYDRDGDLDFFLNGPYGTKLYQNNGNGTFTLVWADGFSTSRMRLALAAGDYDNDGWIDLFSGTAYPLTSSLATLLHNDGNAGFSDVGIPWRKGWEQFAAWCDYDADGDLDLAVSSYNPAGVDQYAFFRIYTNNGAGAFGPLLTIEGVNGGRPAWGDYDNDGDMDLLIGSVPMVFLRNDTLPDGSHQLNRITNGPLVSSTWGDCICPSWGDYDNDGWLDLFVTRGINNGNPGLLFHNNGDGSFSQVTNSTVTTERMHSFGCSWVDYDNNGFLDLFICNSNNELNSLFRNNTNANHWLMLHLKGTTSNTDAIGAKVRLQARIGGKSFWQMREIAGLWEDRRAHFGLGDAARAEVVRIEWPSGTVQELRDVPANQILTVIEPVRLQTTGLGQFHFRAWLGQVFTVKASADLTVWNSIATVTNLTGTVQFTDPEAALSARRFYRVIQP